MRTFHVLTTVAPVQDCRFRPFALSSGPEASPFEEKQFFAAIASSAARAILIGRRALIALGLPLLTRDYDFWIHGDDIAAFNGAVAAFDLFPSHSPEEARAVGRYVLQNDEKVDVLVAGTV